MIGIGAVFYVEHARHLFPEPGRGDDEENSLTAAMIPGELHSVHGFEEV